MKKMLLSLACLLLAVLPTWAQTVVENVPLEAGKYYTIKSDNQAGNKFYLTVSENTLVGNSVASDDLSYYWYCTTEEVDGTTYYRFRNVASNKYLAFKSLSNGPVNIAIAGKKVYNTACLPLYFVGAGKYFLVTDSQNATSSTWNHANDPYRSKPSSDFYFTEVTLSDEQYPAVATDLRAYAEDFLPYVGEGLNQYTDPDGQLQSLMSQNVPTETTALKTYVNELSGAVEALEINQPQPGKYYRIKSYTSGLYIQSDAAKGSKPALVANADETTVFFLSEENRLTGYNCQNMDGNMQFNGKLGGNFEFKSSAVKGHYTIRVVNPGNIGFFYDHEVNGVPKLDTWSDGNIDKCAWTLEEVVDEAMQPKFTKSVSASYATLAAPVALVIPEGIKAYTVTVDMDQKKALLNEITGDIPAGVAVVLEKINGMRSDFEFTFTFTTSTLSNVINNLQGVYTETKISDEIAAYVLANGDYGIGFYLMSADDRTMAANKAYLTLPEEAEAAGIKAFTFDFGGTTGIENTEVIAATAEEYYDLQGRRVENPTKGIYVTKSGKKVVFK